MKPKTLAKIIAAVVAVVLACGLFLYFRSDAERADRVTDAQAEQALDADVSPGLDLDSVMPTNEATETTDSIGEEALDDPTTEPLPALTVPEANLGKATLPKKRTVIFGKFSIRVPSTWCVKNKSSNVEVFFADKSKGQCKAKKAGPRTFVFSDLTTTSSTDLFEAWKRTSCGKSKDGSLSGGILEGPPVEGMIIDGEPVDFYRLTCADGNYNYAWLMLSQDKLVTVKNPTETGLQRAQAALNTIIWD